MRRAYAELASLRLVTARRVRHVVMNLALAPSTEAEIVPVSPVSECKRVLRWSEKNRLSSAAIARLLMKLALGRETQELPIGI